MNCPKTTKIDGVTLHSLCFQSSGKKDFLHKIITGDEKWILDDNPKRKKSWWMVDPGQYPCQEGFALYLVGSERCVVSRVVTCRMKPSRQSTTNNS